MGAAREPDDDVCARAAIDGAGGASRQFELGNALQQLRRELIDAARVAISPAACFALLTPLIEQRLLARSAADVRADVVLVAHHGSGGSSSAEWVAATGARFALVASGFGNRFGHPKPRVVKRWCDSGAEVVDTARAGALRVWLGRGGLQLDERRGSRPRLWDAARRRHGTAGLCYAPETQRP